MQPHEDVYSGSFMMIDSTVKSKNFYFILEDMINQNLYFSVKRQRNSTDPTFVIYRKKVKYAIHYGNGILSITYTAVYTFMEDDGKRLQYEEECKLTPMDVDVKQEEQSQPNLPFNRNGYIDIDKELPMDLNDEEIFTIVNETTKTNINNKRSKMKRKKIIW